jgi:hypothetical protein
MTTLTYSGYEWTCPDGSTLQLDATIKVAVEPDKITLIDATRNHTGRRVEYWQRTALIDWVSGHPGVLRALHRRRMAEMA